jgi:hypothetical protein
MTSEFQGKRQKVTGQADADVGGERLGGLTPLDASQREVLLIATQ